MVNEFKTYDILTQEAMSYAQSKTNFIANRAISQVPVAKESGKYEQWKIGDLIRDDFKLRADGDDYAKSPKDDLVRPTFDCEEYAKEETVGERSANEYRGNLVQAKTNKLIGQALIRREKAFADVAFATNGGFTVKTGSSTTPSDNQFWKFNKTESDPFEIFDEYRAIVEDSTGFPVNTVVVTNDVVRALRHNDVIKATLAANERKIISEAMLADLFGVERFLIMKSVYNNAQKGEADNIGQTETGKMLLMYDPMTNVIDDYSAMKAFVPHTEKLNELGFEIRTKQEDYEGRTKVALKMYWDYKITCDALGVLLTGCI